MLASDSGCVRNVLAFWSRGAAVAAAGGVRGGPGAAGVGDRGPPGGRGAPGLLHARRADRAGRRPFDTHPFRDDGAGVPVLTARIEVGPRGVVVAELTRRGAGRTQVPASDRGAVMRGGDRRAGPGRRHHARPERATGDVAAGGRHRRAIRRRGRAAAAGDAPDAASPEPPPPPPGPRSRPSATRGRGRRGPTGSTAGSWRRPSPVPRRWRCRARPSRSRRPSIARRSCHPPSR